MQLCWYIFSSWSHNDFAPLSHSVAWPRLFLHQRCFWNRISHLFWDSTSHKNTFMHFLGINCLFRKFQGGLYRQVVFLYIQVPFKRDSTVIVHHKNNNVLIQPYNQFTSISWRNLLFIYILNLFFLYATFKLHKYVLYNVYFC